MSDVFWQELACIMHFAFWNVEFVCLQNYVGRVLFAVCGFVDFAVSEKTAYVSSVYCFQIAIL